MALRMKFMLFPYVFFTLLFCKALSVQAQDLIVTKNSDSILCKILSVSDSIKYACTTNGIITHYNIANTGVKNYVFFYYQKNVLTEKDLIRHRRGFKETYSKHKKEAQFYADNRFRLSLNFLYSLRSISSNIIGKNDAVLSQILTQARHNIGFLGDFYVALNKSRSFLIGVEYSRLSGSGSSSNSKVVITDYNSTNTYYGTAVMDIVLYTYGMNAMYLLSSKKAFNRFYFVGGFALVRYVEKFSIGGYALTSSASGSNYSLGIKYDYMLSKHLAVGADVTVNAGTVSASNLGVSIARGTLTAGLRYHL